MLDLLEILVSVRFNTPDFSQCTLSKKSLMVNTGKSSLLNSLLDREDLARAVSCARSSIIGTVSH